MADTTVPASQPLFNNEVPKDWASFIAKFGFATFAAVGLMYFLAFYIVLPMRDDQKAFVNSVVETNRLNATAQASSSAAMQQLTEVQRTQSATLNNLVDQQRQTTTILQQIRDDQRAGAWRNTDPKK